MNPIVAPNKAKAQFVFLISFLTLCLFLTSGFISVTIIAIGLYSVVMFYQNGFRVAEFNKVLLFPMAIYLMYVAWSLMSSNKAGVFLALQTKASLLVLPLCFILVGHKLIAVDKKRVGLVFILANILASLYCLGYAGYNVVKFDSFVDPGNANQDYFFAYDFLTLPIKLDPIYFSMFCNLAVAILLFSDVVGRPVLKYTAVIYLCTFIVLVASKMGIICMVLILFVWFVAVSRSWLAIGIIVLALVPVGWVGVVKLPFLKERFHINTTINYPETDDKKWGSAGFRIAIWSCTVQAISESPIFGYGTADGQARLEEVYRERNFHRGFTDLYNPHNEFLSVTLDLGIAGLLLILATIAAPVRGALKNRDLLALAFLAIVFFNFLVECVFNRQKGTVFFALFYCLLFSMPHSSGQTGKDRAPTPIGN